MIRFPLSVLDSWLWCGEAIKETFFDQIFARKWLKMRFLRKRTFNFKDRKYYLMRQSAFENPFIFYWCWLRKKNKWFGWNNCSFALCIAINRNCETILQSFFFSLSSFVFCTSLCWADNLILSFRCEQGTALNISSVLHETVTNNFKQHNCHLKQGFGKHFADGRMPKKRRKKATKSFEYENDWHEYGYNGVCFM